MTRHNKDTYAARLAFLGDVDLAVALDKGDIDTFLSPGGDVATNGAAWRERLRDEHARLHVTLDILAQAPTSFPAALTVCETAALARHLAAHGSALEAYTLAAFALFGVADAALYLLTQGLNAAGALPHDLSVVAEMAGDVRERAGDIAALVPTLAALAVEVDELRSDFRVKRYRCFDAFCTVVTGHGAYDD